MWTCKIKKTFLLAGLIFSFSTAPAYAKMCNPLNPICLFKMILKITPSMPVLDFVSLPAVIPHVPAAILKEGQTKVKEIADNALEKIRSGELPSVADIKLDFPNLEGSAPAEGQEYASLEAFPAIDSEDPLEISKAIEVLFLRPGWQSGENATMSTYDTQLMKYYRNQFALNNTLEVSGYLAMMRGKVDELLVSAEEVQQQVEKADDLNKAQRANYSAHLMEYQLMIIYNQLLAAQMQMDTSGKLAELGIVLNEEVLRSM